MSSKSLKLIIFLSFFHLHSIAQIPIDTSNEEDDDNVDNPLISSNGRLVSLASADTSMPYQYFINPINEVLVRENRLAIPFSQHNRNIRILDQSIIRTMPVKSVNELLSYVSGIDVRQRGPWGAQSDIGIDGGTFDQTLVLINGIKLTDPQTGHNMMNLPIPLDAIERIEILKGPAAAKYGVNALTGAINIVTKQASFNGISAHVYSGSSFNRDTSDDKLYAGYGIQVGAHLSGDHGQHLLSLSREATSGYRYNTAFQNSKVFYQNNIFLGKESNMQVLGGFVHNNFGANGFYAAPADIESKETVQTALAGINFNLYVNPNWIIKPRISYRYNHDDYIFVRQNPSIYRNRHETHIINTELNNTFLTSIGDFGLGLEWRREEINSSNLGKWDRSNYGFYGEYSFNKVDRLLINLSAFANYNSDFGWQVFPSADIGYTFYKNFRGFANIGTGQRLPTYTDWYYKGPSNIGNPDLKPEKSLSTEIGIKYNEKRLNAQMSYFYRSVHDFIDWVKQDLNDPWQPQNFQNINTNGFSLAADYRIRDNYDNKKSTLAMIAGVSYTYLQPTIEQPEGNNNNFSQYALENLRHQFSAHTNLEIIDHFNVTLAARYQKRISYKDYTLLDFRVSYVHEKFNIYADITNLFNTTYIEAAAIPMPGRWFTVGFKWAWKYR